MEVLVTLHVPFIIRKMKMKFHWNAVLYLSDWQVHLNTTDCQGCGKQN